MRLLPETSQGTVSLDVVVAGSGFDNTSKAQFLVSGTADPGGITVRKTVFHNSKEIVATIDVADTAVVANFDIQVTLDSGRKGKGTTLFAVKQKQVAVDPCIGAQGTGFPALAFVRQRTTTGTVYYDTILADSTGKCEKTMFTYSYNDYGRDVNIRYLATTGQGVAVRSTTGSAQGAAAFTVSFDSSGVPTVLSTAYTTILTLADLPIPTDLTAAGWSQSNLGNTFIAPDGTAVLLSSGFNNSAGQSLQVLWTCPFDASALIVDKANCRDLYRRIYTSGITGNWSARGDAIYITDTASSGSGTGLYRLRLSDGNLEQIWSRGTRFTAAKAKLDSALHERVAVYEPDSTPYPNSSLCSKVLVIDADTCVNNSCQILNGAGNPARSVTWLPDGRVAGEGQSAPSRRGMCSAAGSIATFDPTDTTGTSSTLITSGGYPDGAGGG